jgi:hypothetical protein
MKRKLHIATFIIVCSIVFGIMSCTEKIELNTEVFEDVLVVEATITDEIKFQEIKLSRTYLLENDAPIIENSAHVKIEDSNQNTYNFHNTGDGIYRSDIEFQAIEGVAYKLIIDTELGKQYVSSEEFLTPKANLDRLYAELVTVNGDLGVQVLVDSNDILNDGQFFRYEYEETYKIETPYYSGKDAETYDRVGIPPNFTYSIRVFENPERQKICYSTNYSSKIILATADELSENKISRFPIRFIKQDNSILISRYSILVKQYVQSSNASNYYRILKKLGDDASLLLDNQPGFVKGNIISRQNNQEKVIGYFDVSSVTSKRIYFNYLDFPELSSPPYFYDCLTEELDYNKTTPEDALGLISQRERLYNLLGGGYKFFNFDGTSVYGIAYEPCLDCTYFSSSVKPDFWEE